MALDVPAPAEVVPDRPGAHPVVEFMLLCVPEPVCHTKRGNFSSSLPAMASSAACTMTLAFQSDSRPAS